MSPPWLEPRTAYIHVPFCAHHCGYCDFAVAAGQDHLIELYSTRSPRNCRPRRAAAGRKPVHRRGHADASERRTTAAAAGIRAEMAAASSDSPEFSIESTPESLDDEKVASSPHWRQPRQHRHPVVSPGLAACARSPAHVGQIPAGRGGVRRHIPASSFDLIFARAGSTRQSWAADLDAALAFEPQHISTYGLTYEKGTPLWKDRERGW